VITTETRTVQEVMTSSENNFQLVWVPDFNVKIKPLCLWNNVPCKCAGLTLAGCQVPTQPLYHSLSSAGEGEKVQWKSSWVKTSTATGKPDLIWGN